ncbi:deoxyribodipyrimidine photolyase-like uncharacterized protein [Streptomyces sp. AK010]|nr:deoxyribodipyrimidine photolyase-like uncharacterized protein [Streptomyces sp. AK010]
MERAERAWREGEVPVNSAEGFVRQVAGWREYVWQLYWYFGDDYRQGNALGHTLVLVPSSLSFQAEVMSEPGAYTSTTAP